ncbi:MAG: hypothetical protein AB7P04_05425, partial [Bacteriovoracia bacterium]
MKVTNRFWALMMVMSLAAMWGCEQQVRLNAGTPEVDPTPTPTTTLVPVILHSLSLEISNPEHGSLRAEDPDMELDCPGACEASLEEGTEIVVTAQPINAHWEAQWPAACVVEVRGESTVCRLNLSQDEVLSVTFIRKACSPDTVDLNGDDADGCECHITSPADSPDTAFQDTNCDGIDGTRSAGVFVDIVSGTDAATSGTMSQPTKTIRYGITRAQALGRREVYVSRGTYAERVELVNGISLFGGYDAAAQWQRSATHTTTIQPSAAADLGGNQVALVAANISQSTQVQRFTIVGPQASQLAGSSYGVYCIHCPALALRDNVIQAKYGAPGTAGTSGPQGTPGGYGVSGRDAVCSNPNPQYPSAGGSGGVGAVALTYGGRGGDSGLGATAGRSGAASAQGILGGLGGQSSTDGSNAKSGANGANAPAALTGTDGSNGNGGGSVEGFWVSAAGKSGETGN